MKFKQKIKKLIASKRANKYFFIALSCLFMVGVWWIWAEATFVNRPTAPSPPVVFGQVFALIANGTIWPSIFNTLLKVLIAFSISFVLGLGFAILAAVSTNARNFFSPVITLIRALPTVGVVLLLLILVSSPQVAAVTIASMMVFPLLYENFYTAIGQTDKDLLQMAKVHKIPFIKQLSGIYVLHMSPYIFGSGAAGISMGLKVVVAAEIITIPLGSTLGTAMDGASRVGSVELLFAWLLIAVLLCFVLEGVIKLAGWVLMPWRRVKND